MTYFQDNGQIEPKSPSKGAWSAIYDKAPYKNSKAKKEMVSYSKVFRHPEESSRRALNPRTVARKAASAAKIQKLKNAAKRYEILTQNPECKVRASSAGIYIQPRVGGKFQPRIILPS